VFVVALLAGLGGGLAHAASSDHGAQSLQVSKSADSPTTVAGSTNGYTITISNPHKDPVEVASIVDDLPSGFVYTPGSSTDATTANPARDSGGRLTWTGPFTVPGKEEGTKGTKGTIVLHFNVTVASKPDDYYNTAAVTQGKKDLNSSGPTAKVTVTKPPNGAPVCDGSSKEVAAGGSASIDLVCTDPDGPAPLSRRVVSGPGHGTVSAVTTGGSVTYTPADGYTGVDSFTFEAVDAEGALSNVATASITVTGADGGAPPPGAPPPGEPPPGAPPPGAPSDAGHANDRAAATGITGDTAADSASSDPGGGVAGTRATSAPAPEERRTGNVETVSGDVFVTVPGSATPVRLDQLRQIPVGSRIEATSGEVRLAVDNGEGIQTAVFGGGAFVFTQHTVGSPPARASRRRERRRRTPRDPRLFTDLKLVGGDFSGCSRATTATARTARSRGRRLWGRGKGRFRTRGRRASAIVRGTVWETIDGCASTVVRVSEGVVAVTDFGTHRTVMVPAGRSYTARVRGG